MSNEGQLDIYLDGSCAFCQWMRARIKPWDKHNRLRFLDYNDPAIAAPTPFSLEQLDREMHLYSPDGTWSAGFHGFIKILRVLPGLAWLGWLLSKPPLRWAGPRLYVWVAAHRALLPGAPPPCIPHTCAPQKK